jgi:hypothetical protein
VLALGLQKIPPSRGSASSSANEGVAMAMADSNVPLPLLMAHIEEIIRSIARLHAEHHQNATPLQRAVAAPNSWAS